jgi:uncharacterized membrane protein HdeD (DUF308 family)
MIMVLARNWWALALRGFFAILFGLAAFALPGLTLGVLVLLFGGYALVEGVFAVVTGVRAAERHERWWPMIFEGVAGILAGLATFVWPAMTAVLLLYVVSAWAIVTGVFKVISAIRLRRHLRRETVQGLNGVISVLFGLFLLLLVPGVGLLALVWWVAGYAMFRGLMLLALAFRLRRHHLLGPGRLGPEGQQEGKSPG